MTEQEKSTSRHYGGVRDPPDHRDHRLKYGLQHIPSTVDHPSVDLRNYIDHVYDQGDLESCTANALCAAYGLDLKKQAKSVDRHYHYFNSSRLFVYYNSRKYSYQVTEDSGVPLREALKAFYHDGVCEESCWPYDASKVSVEPPAICYTTSAENNISKYHRLHQDIHQFRACLVEGHPFVFGFEVYSSFHSPSNEKEGKMPMPTAEEIAAGKYYLHVALAVGYDDKKEYIIALNSWGESFGDKGYFYVPYKFITDPKLSFDFWKITFVRERGVQITTEQSF